MADPVAWTMIESGWKVFDAEGEEIGTVDEVTGDENVEGEVHLSLTRPQVEALETFVEPAPEEQIIPEKSTWYQRFAWKWLTGRKR
jgi:sporulation protein YlmC with PRC-barrel domain